MKKWLMVVTSFGLLWSASHIAAQDTDVCEARQLTDILPDSDVTMVVFGGAQVDVALASPLSFSAIATNRINLRAEPSTNGAIVGSLGNGEAITVIARNEAGDWLRLNHNGETAWVFANLVNVDGDKNSLPVGEAAPAATSGVVLNSVSHCEDVVNSGLLLQSPFNEVRQVTVNGLPVYFNGTVLLKSANNVTRVLNVDFNSAVAVGNAGIEILSGGYMDIGADGSATELAAYSLYDLIALPLDLLPIPVQRPINVATNYGLSPCGFLDDDGSLTAAPAGQPLEIRISTSGDQNSQELLTNMVNEGKRVLTVDGETIELWSIHGPYIVGENMGVTWYWIALSPQPGTYELELTTSATDTELDGVLSCTLVVE